ncbi:MAG: molecular chaperone HtpG, partial [Candidatus Alkaliphilus sp. MAG34]
LSEKGFEILYLTDDVDEFALKMLNSYKEKEFRSVSGSDLGIEDKEDKDENAEKDTNKELFEKMKTILSDKVKDVRTSKRLKSHPVCLINEGEISIEMEKVLSVMPDNQKIKAEKVLEVNKNHEVFKALEDAYKNDEDRFELFTKLLYNQALLIEGLSVNNPVEFSNDICRLMI